jgi:hypothetical protein
MPSREEPLTGSCLCGAVRFEVTEPFQTAGYCHCKRCQRRSGTLSTLNGTVAAEGFRIVAGADALRAWQPPDGRSKSFCVHCGGHVYSGERDGDPVVGVRLGAIDGDPGVRPEWHQWVESAPEWDPLPEDGLPRFPQRRPTS